MIKPFLKWAGGKSRLSGRINELLIGKGRLIEPFVGSGAIFMNTDYDEYLLSDSNRDLINLYNHLKNEGNDFIDFTEYYFTQDNNVAEKYYELREIFNTTEDTRLKSALFIYLNRHCFNGLCRYNSKGGFNVPFGKYTKPSFPKDEMICFHKKSALATFEIADFRDVMIKAKVGDMVYCDPPYVPISLTSNFTSYATGGFDMKDQEDLSDLAKKLKNNGIPVLISNHSTDWTKENYKTATISEFDVQRFISSDINNRGKARELLALFS
jgi:DNA adenine methylase